MAGSSHPKAWPAFIRGQLDAATMDFCLVSVFGPEMQHVRASSSKDLLPKFRRVCSLLGGSDYTMFLDLGPQVPKAVTALRALISLLAPKKGTKMAPLELLGHLREEMLGRHGDEIGAAPVLQIRDVLAVVKRMSFFPFMNHLSILLLILHIILYPWNDAWNYTKCYINMRNG